MITQIIGVRDLFKTFRIVLEKTSRGAEYIIVKNSKPVAKIVPYWDTEEALNKIVPVNDEHKEIIEAHRQYLRGECFSQEEVEKLVKARK